MSKDKIDKMVTAYLEEIAKTPLLTREEEIKLAKRIKAGDQEAKQELAKANLRFVVFIAKNYVGQSKNLALLDLIQEGNFGLMRAANGTFDWKKGFRFITYASPSIERAIWTALRMDKMSIVKNSLVTSLDAPITTEDGKAEDSMYNFVEDKSAVSPNVAADKGLLNEVLIKALSILNEKERKVVSMYFGLENGIARTQEEISEKLNTSRERVRQMLAISLRKLKRHKNSSKLKKFMLA